ncbi:DUF2971 domain-containing protein [Mesorhizobium jarvisii]|uniref:DUF2971 domain-containing protein n=1 Tax=Mesorhizobium jarvisii TaxID=1777867 RepID=UPI001F0B4651|nr:DUF2971 domain-containing protein [Mesorhizobium jarvisii]MCH4560331.1 DUF2971 domain-containing protein [Mesorhizobium jarvisii]
MAENAEPIKTPFLGLAQKIIDPYRAKVKAPTRLYHYTSSAGLIGIVQNSRLWFSDSAFMNDGSELQYGMDIFRRKSEAMLAKKPEKNRNSLDALMEFLTGQQTYNRQIIFCMSDHGNLLNQWRDYGKDVTAYSIELDTLALLQDEFNFRPGLYSLIYDEATQDAIMEKFVEELFEIDQSVDYSKLDKDTQQSYIMSGAAEATFVMSHFKNPAFNVENEWRFTFYAAYSAKEPKPQFRASALGVVPYYEWHRSNGGKLPITRVMVGPSPYAKASDIALKLFLFQAGYPEVETLYSTIPIRK